MLLREEHFAVFQANWSDKATNIKAISEELALGLESLVFVDDNPFERELVRKALPQVAIPEMPSDPALFARTLAAAGYFELATFSQEDLSRAAYYDGNARRAVLQKQVGDLNQYLASLDMEITFQPFNETGRARIAQLINKSNQFNLTTRRYTEAEVAEMESDPNCFTLQVRLTDSFGDNGMISVIICRPTAGGQLGHRHLADELPRARPGSREDDAARNAGARFRTRSAQIDRHLPSQRKEQDRRAALQQAWFHGDRATRRRNDSVGTRCSRREG